MGVKLYDFPGVTDHLLPFTYVRPAADIRIGILTIREKWEKYFDQPMDYHIQHPHLAAKFGNSSPAAFDLLINGALCPDPAVHQAISNLQAGEALFLNGQTLACRVSQDGDLDTDQSFTELAYDQEVCLLRKPWDIFLNNGEQIRRDFELITTGRKSQQINDPHTVIYEPSNVFVEEGATIRASVINAENGPVYLGKNSVVHEGCLIKGPFVLGESSHLNMGAKMKGDNTIGPFCKVGGEVSNSVFFGYSNKGHDGFLGNSVIGEWCNLGADTNSSNLKNNYSSVRVWDYTTNSFNDSQLQFCGLLMGDHAKSGINTMFNTGTVVGVAANVYGGSFPDKFLPSFSWGGSEGLSTYEFEKCMQMCKAVMRRRKVELTAADTALLKAVFEKSASHRTWEVKT